MRLNNRIQQFVTNIYYGFTDTLGYHCIAEFPTIKMKFMSLPNFFSRFLSTFLPLKFIQIGNVKCKILIIFSAINLNICFGCSKEPSHLDSLFEYPHEKDIFVRTLTRRLAFHMIEKLCQLCITRHQLLTLCKPEKIFRQQNTVFF